MSLMSVFEVPQSVYLAGPITGLPYDGSVNWRDEAQQVLASWGIWGISPMRCKSYLKSEVSIADSYEQHPLSSQKGITSRDRFDVMRASCIFVNLLCSQTVSIGTVMEIAWADMLRKPIILVMEQSNLHNHPMIRESASVVVSDFAQALDITRDILLM